MPDMKNIDRHLVKALAAYDTAIGQAAGRIMEKDRLGHIEIDQVFSNIESKVDEKKRALSVAALIWLDNKMPYLASVNHAIRAQQLNRLFEIFHHEVPKQISFWDMRLLVRQVRKLSIKTAGEILLETIDDFLPGLFPEDRGPMDSSD